jgi:hypothetical protein
VGQELATPASLLNKMNEADWNETASRILEFVELNQLSKDELETVITIAEQKWLPSQWKAMMQIMGELRYLRNKMNEITSKKRRRSSYD